MVVKDLAVIIPVHTNLLRLQSRKVIKTGIFPVPEISIETGDGCEHRACVNYHYCSGKPGNCEHVH